MVSAVRMALNSVVMSVPPAPCWSIAREVAVAAAPVLER